MKSLVGKLFYNPEIDRLDIVFEDKSTTYRGLECGNNLEIDIYDKWVPVSVQFDIIKEEWYLYHSDSVRIMQPLDNAKVRIPAER